MTAVLLQPDPRRKRLLVTVDAPADAEISAIIREVGVSAAGSAGQINLPFPEFTPWAPGQPHLYTLDCQIRRGGTEESLSVPFGMREWSIQEQRLCVNQRPVVLKGLRLGADPGDRDADRMEALARSGFNWLRFDAREASQAELERASELGLMVSLHLGRAPSVDGLAESVRKFGNFAAVAIWEAGGGEETAQALRKLDPTRPVLSRSPDSPASRAYRPYGTSPDELFELSTSFLMPVSRETESVLQYSGHARAINLINISGLSSLCGNTFETSVPDAILANSDAIEDQNAEAIRASVDRLRSNARIAGYCFTDRFDTRNSSARLGAFREAHASVRPVITMTRSNLVPREEVDVSVALLNEARLEGRAELSLQVVGPTNQVLWKKKRGVKLPKHGRELWTGTVAASGSVGTHRFVVQVLDERGGKIAENGVTFHVSPPVERWTGPVDVVDPGGRWLQVLKPLAPHLEATAPIILIPPLASTIRAYPDNPLGQALGRVREGAVGIVFLPPEDWDDLGATLSTPVETAITSVLEDAPAGSVGAARLHPLFEGLPAGGPLARPYRGLLTDSALVGESEEDISPLVTWNGEMRMAHRVMVRRLGNGRLIFTTLKFLDRLGRDPVLDRLFVNLLRHSERRAIASKEIARVEARAIEWLRRERGKLRVWRLIGPFANWDGDGHEKAYPPESGYEAEATYAGWYRAAAWQTWHQRPEDGADVPLSRVLRPDAVRIDPYPGTFYAYTDLTSEERLETRLTLHHTGHAKCWLNGRAQKLETAAGADAPGADVVLKQGRNAMLVKLSVTDSPAIFSLQIGTQPRDEAGLRWL